MNVSPSSSGDSHLARLFDELCTRLEAGQTVDLESYRDQHPEQAEELSDLLPAVQLLFDLRDAETAASALHTEPEIGVLGDFRLIRQLGRGGMGVVFAAEQISLGRRVALKVLPFASVLKPTELQRFQNEIQIAAGLDHPNIVRVFSVGCDRGVHYFAMQLIDGQSLAEVISQLRDLDTGGGHGKATSHAVDDETPQNIAERQPGDDGDRGVPEAVDTGRVAWAHVSTARSKNDVEYVQSVARLGVQATRALQHAHERHIVHRDIKPSNLMVDANGHLYVTDFGLARAQSETGLTASGDVLGTLRYMSPEQAAGDPHAVDHRSDIYSLGATLYELLTLQPAFSAEDRYRLLETGVHESPPLPREWNESIPPDLESIALKSMEHDPQLRYATAQELADDLTRYLAGEEVQAARSRDTPRTTKWFSRRRHMMWTATVLLSVIVAGWICLNRWPIGTAPIDAQGLNNRGVESASRGQMKLALDDFQRAIAFDPARAEYYNNRGVARAGLGESGQATEDLDKAIRIDPALAVAYANRAIVRAALGQLDLALEDVRQLQELEESAAQDHHAATIAWISVSRGDEEHLRLFRDEASRLLSVTDNSLNAQKGTGTLETREADESALPTTELTGPASLGRLVCTPGKMALAIVSQTDAPSQSEDHAMLISKKKDRRMDRKFQRRLEHETLEPRMLLTGTDPGWLFNVGAEDAGFYFTGPSGETVVDTEGNTYVSGQFQGAPPDLPVVPVDFDPGPGVVELITGSGIGYVAKYASDGSCIWARQFPQPPHFALSDDGYLYVSGSFRDTVILGDTTLISRGDYDMFLSRLDGDGDFLWSVRAGSTGHDVGRRTDVDLAGYVYVTGNVGGDADFGLHELTVNNVDNAFVAKFDSNGQFLWVQGMGANEEIVPRGNVAASSDDGSLYVSGYFRGTADFGTHQIVSSGEEDAFVAKLSSLDGAFQWAQRMGGELRELSVDIAVDSADNIVVTGSLVSSAADFGVFQLTSVGQSELFVFKMDPTGRVVWAHSGNASDYSVGRGIAVDADDNVYVTGYFKGVSDFDPGSGSAQIVSGNPDGFVWKVDSGGNFVAAKRMGGPARDDGYDVAVNAQGNVHVHGQTWRSTLDPAPVSYFPNGTLSPISIDMFVAKLPARMFEMHDELFSDSFENGTWNGQWIEDSQDDWFTSTQRATLGAYSAEVDGRANDAMLTVANPIDLTPYGSAELTFDWYIEGTLDAGEYLAVDLFNGTTWTEAARLSGDVQAEDVWHQPYVQIPAEYLVSNFQFRFRAKMSGSDEDANLDNVQLVATSLGVPHAPTAVADSYSALKDQPLNVLAPGVLGNDSDGDNDPIAAVPWSGTTTSGGQVALNSDGSFSYTPPTGFTGSDTFSYTVTDGTLSSDPATVSIEVSSASANALYVYDIRFESKRGDKDWRAIFEIRSDSNADGQGGVTDTVAEGVSITVEFAGQTYTGTTDSAGLFRTSWFNNLSSGNHYAEVVDLVLASYTWNPLTMDLEDDSDGDGLPDDILSV